MQFRFVEESSSGNYSLLGYDEIKDFSEAYKTFNYMKEHKCDFCVMLNTADLVDTDGEWYIVKDVCFVAQSMGREIIPHFMVILEGAC